MFSSVKEYATDFFELFYPVVCAACSQKLLKGEHVICHRCFSNLPATDFWTDNQNTLAKRFWGRVHVQGAAALYKFNKLGHTQHLLHQLKYKGREDVGEYFGKATARMIKQEHCIIRDIDVVVPVPLHWKKEKLRGYNQCDLFARTIATAIQADCITDAIARVHENISQTKKKRFDRWGNVSEIFALRNYHSLQGKHVLLVDDVVTTGATAEACLSKLLTVPDTRVSFVAMAIAVT